MNETREKRSDGLHTVWALLTAEVTFHRDIIAFAIQTMHFVKRTDEKIRDLRVPRQIQIILFLIVVAYSLRLPFQAKPVVTGDGSEYLTMTQSIINHGSLEATREDLENVADSLSFQQELNVANGYFQSPRNGSYYSYHAPFYSLFLVPATLFFQQHNGNLVAACQATDIILISIAVAGILFVSALTARRKIVFTALLLASPVWWYLSLGTGVEVFSLSFVVMSLVALSRKCYPLAALLASIAALQNPPLLAFVLYIVGLSFMTKQFRCAALTLGASCVSLLPFAYFQYLFGVPSLINLLGGASLQFVTLDRIISVFIDLNQGFLPYVPITLLLFVLASVRTLRQRDRNQAVFFACILGVVALCCTTKNWNSGCFGLMRYAVWVYPLLLWAIIHSSRFKNRLSQLLVVAAVIGQAETVKADFTDHLRFTPVAKSVMEYFPQYPMDDEIRRERRAHKE